MKAEKASGENRWMSYFRFSGRDTTAQAQVTKATTIDRKINRGPSVATITTRLSKLALVNNNASGTNDDAESANMRKEREEMVVQKERPTSEDQLEQLTRLGLYDIGTTIGKGTFSKVKLGVNSITKEKAAIKIITKNERHRGFTTKHIFQEVNVQKRANHRRICQILNVFDTGSLVCIVLEYAPIDLLQYINSTWNKKLTDCESRRLFYQLMDAVAFLHTLNIVHRDVKPQNLLLDTEYNVKLTDFGYCTETNCDMLTTVCGSNVYAAPELVRRKQPYNGKAADMWACGVVLFNMLIGKMPFKALGDRVKTEARHVLYDPLISEEELTRNLVIPPHVKPLAANLMMKIICIDYRQRYTSEQIFEHAWMQLPFPEGPDPVMRTRIKNYPGSSGKSAAKPKSKAADKRKFSYNTTHERASTKNSSWRATSGSSRNCGSASSATTPVQSTSIVAAPP
ncbi:CAMK/CAMKL protein kinase [Sphaeroforma arctica JP610]|uniref:CAMK/CAMKL protein kinase n=1 Tax=Sphaeroforma arctica JP610 TaxID=667725 RepID=A0A0L0FQX4_9EUKA|nr:CAMK/CAMKL protein kinase [Sphaeroforma arctica JP610]KNC79207.1 CAMK/CAMKL protein kinase [Sphaeroforma arctica JP610]|eukprot:XP_014153109.1 CAMK/CAMKL protein kinase [Sphaeroforma arctica JP610]